MNDKEINAALAEVGAGWLMDSSDEHCQSAAMRHLVAAVKAAERERCAAVCKAYAMRHAADDDNTKAQAWMMLQCSAEILKA